MRAITIVIVNWSSGSQLRECVRSLRGAAERAPVDQVIVIDNDSRDGSVDGLPEWHRLTVVRNPSNYGFGRACNQGARMANGDFLLFLNPDVRLLPDSLVLPLRFMETPESSRVGVCSIRLVSEQGVVARDCWRFPRMSDFFGMSLGLDRAFPGLRFPRMREWAHDCDRRVDHV
ncbi:MAG: glycosyltransferase, partial [Pseudomonadota bacterium]